MPVNYYTGGMSSISYKLAHNKKIEGFGSKRNINNPLFRGGADPEEPEKIKRPRGRPPTIKQEPEEYYTEEEGDIIESKKRGRPTKPHNFESNIVDTLNGLLGKLSIEESIIKKNETNPELKQVELKRIRAMKKQISNAYLHYV